MKLSPKKYAGLFTRKARYIIRSLQTLTASIPNEEKQQYCHNIHSSQLPNKTSKNMPKTLHYSSFNMLKMP